jgi:hypothetical protein
VTVSPELHRKVLTRDQQCFLKLHDATHQCRDKWGYPHPSYDLSKLTVDHVNDQATMGKRAPDDEQHLISMCYYSNVQGPSRIIRQAEREYLNQLYSSPSG